MDPEIAKQQDEAQKTEAMRLASALGMTTADKIPPPKKAIADDHADIRKKWSLTKDLIFKTLKPGALCFVATDGPVSVTLMDAGGVPTRRIGHNRGVWPAKVVRSGTWRDNATATYDKSPFAQLYCGTQWRLWCDTIEQRDRLAERFVDFLAELQNMNGSVGPEVLRPGFHDMGEGQDLAMLEMDAKAAADALGISVRDDAGLSAYLDTIENRLGVVTKGQITPELIYMALARVASHEG